MKLNDSPYEYVGRNSSQRVVGEDGIRQGSSSPTSPFDKETAWNSMKYGLEMNLFLCEMYKCTFWKIDDTESLKYRDKLDEINSLRLG